MGAGGAARVHTLLDNLLLLWPRSMAGGRAWRGETAELAGVKKCNGGIGVLDEKGSCWPSSRLLLDNGGARS